MSPACEGVIDRGFWQFEQGKRCIIDEDLKESRLDRAFSVTRIGESKRHHPPKQPDRKQARRGNITTNCFVRPRDRMSRVAPRVVNFADCGQDGSAKGLK